jgi:putative ABC transport system permease protein
LGSLLSIYAWRLRQHAIQELLAGMGIAVGVALMFGVLTASQSITGSAGQALHGIIGSARLQLLARSPDGFDEELLRRIAQIPGVRVAAPVLRRAAVIVGSKGRRSVQLIGVTASQVALRGAATRNLGRGTELLVGGIGLTSGVADEVGASSGQSVTLLAAGQAHRVAVRSVLGREEIGPVANSPVVAALLPLAQAVLDQPHRITQVLIEPQRGTDRQVEAGLRKLAGARLGVEAADHELRVLRATAQPTEQSSKLFAAIGAIVGFLLAVNAMLLTVPERRRWVAELRTQGFSAGQVVLILASQAVILGAVASCVGVLLGDVLAHTLLSAVPSYLTLAFPIGTHPIVTIATVAIVVGFGVIATLSAAAAPIQDVLRRRPIDSVLDADGKVGHSIGSRTVIATAAVGLAMIVAITLFVLLAPGLSIVGGILLALAVLSLAPSLLVITVSALKPISERIRGSMLAIALIELEGTATRSIALAGVTAVAVYGSVAVQGAQHDLLKGLNLAVVQYLDTADIWVTTSDHNFLTIDSFKAGGVEGAIARAPGVASVRVYQGALLDVAGRRLWIRARPAADRTMIQKSQLLHGNITNATELIRRGAWAAVSSGFADEHNLRTGRPFALPTPGGSMPLRVAAITTNAGWPPGAITINSKQYGRWWGTSEPTALEINLQPGVSVAAGKRAVQRTLGQRPGLLVQGIGEREAQYEQSARQGVKSLSEISTLVLIAAALAIAFALSATISARARDLAARKAEGYQAIQLWRSLVAESAVVLGVGAVDGALCGLYGHALASRWLRISQGFPAPFSPDVTQVLLTLAFIAAIALIVIAAFGLRAARVSPAVSLQE